MSQFFKTKVVLYDFNLTIIGVMFTKIIAYLIFRWENNDENSSAPPSKVVLKKKDDLFDISDSEDDLFPSVKPAGSSKSSSSYQPNTTKSSFNSSPWSSSLSSKSTSSPFYSEIKQPETDKEDDLFSDQSIASTGFKPKVTDLFSDDLFSNDSNDSFSNHVPVNPKSKSFKDTVYIGDDDPLFSSVHSSDKSISKNVKSNNFENNPFPDEVDLFGSTTKLEADSLFDAPSSSMNADNIMKNTHKIPVSSSLRPLSKGLFDDDEDDVLFSNNLITNVPPSKSTFEKSWLDSNKINTLDTQSKQSISTNENEDLFSSSQQVTEVGNDRVKVKSGNLKPKKALERRSLFDSDSDDDLFSSPQGSLSSRKSLQATNTHVINKADVHKQQQPSNQETKPTKKAKTDFSSIFSNEASDVDIFSNSHKVSVVSTDSLFDEEKDLFYQANNTNVKTPDLFTNTSSQTTSKPSEPSNDSLAVAKSYTNNKEMSSLDKMAAIESVNPKLVSSSEEVSNNVPEISSKIKTKLVSGSESNKPEIIHKKPEPPKSLGIKPISESLSVALPKGNVKVSQNSEFPKQSTTTVYSETVEPNDALDGEAISVPTPSKANPGRCKYLILQNIVNKIYFVLN